MFASSALEVFEGFVLRVLTVEDEGKLDVGADGRSEVGTSLESISAPFRKFTVELEGGRISEEEEEEGTDDDDDDEMEGGRMSTTRSTFELEGESVASVALEEEKADGATFRFLVGLINVEELVATSVF